MIQQLVVLLGAIATLLTGLSTKLVDMDKRMAKLERMPLASSILRLGSGGQVTDTISVGASIAVGASLTGGTANRVLYENSTNLLAEDADLTFNGSLLTTSNFIASASSTVAAAFNVSGAATLNSTLGIATTTVGASALIAAESTSATTTLYLASTRSDRAGCIQLEGPASTTYRIYVNPTSAAATTTGGALQVEVGSCN